LRILVTGGTGYVGRVVVSRLRRAGHHVVLYGRSAAPTADAGVTPIQGDILDAPRLTEAACGCQAILHMAALVSVWRRHPRDFDEINIRGLRHILDAARRWNVPRVVYTSSFLAITPRGLDQAPAWNDYQRTKASADELATRAVAEGAPLVRLYPGVIYGPGALTDGNLVGRQIADHLAGRLPGIVGADRIWSFSYVDDVADAHVAAAERGAPGTQYLLGGDNAPQMRVFEIVRAVTGRALPRRLPGWLIAAGAVVEELRAPLFGGSPLVTTGTLEILLRDWPLENALARDELAFTMTPLDQGVRAILDQLVGSAAGQPSGSSAGPS
jgi:farnesol dehydrogenase